MRIKPIPDSIRDAYRYDPQTGAVTTSYGRLSNSRTTNGKYLKLTHEGKDYLLHRVVWFLHFGEQPPPVIDHIDGDGANNAPSNLRAATTSTNQMNITATSKSTTGIKGIFPVRGGKLYRAEVCIEGKRYQKHAAKPEKLLAWVEEMRNKLHGEYARHA